MTANDLDAWSDTLDSRAHLPTLIRRLIFASVNPDEFSFPNAEGTGLPGLDGMLHRIDGAHPYVPLGRSAWELKTSKDAQRELGKDYRKRTRQTAGPDRAMTTIVLAWIHRSGGVAGACRNTESAFLYGRMTVFKASHNPDQKDTFCEHIFAQP